MMPPLGCWQHTQQGSCPTHWTTWLLLFLLHFAFQVCEKYDRDRTILIPEKPAETALCVQWIFFGCSCQSFDHGFNGWGGFKHTYMWNVLMLCDKVCRVGLKSRSQEKSQKKFREDSRQRKTRLQKVAQQEAGQSVLSAALQLCCSAYILTEVRPSLWLVGTQ